MNKKLLLSLVLVSAVLVGINLPDADNANEVNAEFLPYQIPNGGFENGDLSGWTRYGIWKTSEEPNLIAFHPERVVSTAYYGSGSTDLYNREGNYHLGVYAYPYVEANKNLNQERMGHLRSSNFLLGGSGWISFRLGGGKSTATAYMSIRLADTHTEVVRFGNRHFGKTALSGTSNAEAYMFQYYYDLSEYLADEMYITLTEAASHEWCVLSADSIITYYSTAPTIGENPPSGDLLAVDIKPSINGVSSSTNAISNELTSNITNWENPNNVFRWDSAARTNAILGNSDLGAARSPAFNINGTNTHLLWDWEGNIQNDKQLFVSVKEVGTNIEVKRLVRRANLSTKSGGGLDNHWTSLAALNVSKEYYVEFIDNLNEDWGCISVKNVRLRPSNDEKVVSGDEAVSITPLTTDFSLTYVQDAKSYGAYFLEQTASYCTALDGGNVPWTTLETEYTTLSNDAKNYFVASGTTDAEIVGARDRFVFLYNKYKPTHLSWNYFLVSSTNAQYNPLAANPEMVQKGINFESMSTIIVISGLFLLGTGFYLFGRKRINL